ncbi:hypothetical protein G6F21_014688 [Rhizopus arrhizus]|nr:hypothetical protein G6F21_014688 [Rhizopus arrhizus]
MAGPVHPVLGTQQAAQQFGALVHSRRARAAVGGRRLVGTGGGVNPAQRCAGSSSRCLRQSRYTVTREICICRAHSDTL